jgi:DNA phosphorothioation-associated putative methyltransferase
MIVGAVLVDGLREFGDGYLKARGTFQKYFQQAELKAMLTQVTGVERVALAPGIFALPLARGRAGLPPGATAGTTSVHGRLQGRSPRQNDRRPTQLADRIASAIDAIAGFALERGRLPHPDEMPSNVHAFLAAERVSFAQALEASLDAGIDAELFVRAAAERREDLLVHQALNILNRSRTATRPSPAMVRDIRQQFGSQQQFRRTGARISPRSSQSATHGRRHETRR